MTRYKLASWTLLALVLVGEMFISACSTPIPATPVRPFTTMDLLIDPSDMPEGWEVSENSPSRILDYLAGRDPATADDASGILFLADKPYVPWHETVHDVYRFKTLGVAKHVYESFDRGETPPGWTYKSPVAKESKFLCHTKKQGLTYCTWVAYYDEYYVEFAVALIPGKMSLEDVERIVKIIDEKMAQYLKPLE